MWCHLDFCHRQFHALQVDIDIHFQQALALWLHVDSNKNLILNHSILQKCLVPYKLLGYKDTCETTRLGTRLGTKRWYCPIHIIEKMPILRHLFLLNISIMLIEDIFWYDDFVGNYVLKFIYFNSNECCRKKHSSWVEKHQKISLNQCINTIAY